MGRGKSKVKKKMRRMKEVAEQETSTQTVHSNHRKICHQCGTEITHQTSSKIYSEGTIMIVCPLCHAKYIRGKRKCH